MTRDPERGNILFLILLAVVLFAALSYAVTNSLRGGGTNANAEKVEADVAATVQYLTSVSTAIKRIMLMNSCKDTQISFDHNNGATSCLTSETPATGYENANSPTNCKCHVFHPLGGGIAYQAASTMPHAKYGSIAPYDFSGVSSVPNIGLSGRSELYYLNIMSFPSTGAPTEAQTAWCNAYNRASNNDGFSLSAFSYGATATKFTGTFTDSGNLAAMFANKPAVCYRYQDNDRYTFYFVLVER